MSFYRTFITAVAAMGLATSVFAADEATATTDTMNATTEVTTTTTSTTTETTKLNLNTATAKELAKVDGLNKSKANAIVSYRKKHGDFKSVEDLKEVKGFKKMNEDTMKKIADQLTIG